MSLNFRGCGLIGLTLASALFGCAGGANREVVAPAPTSGAVSVGPGKYHTEAPAGLPIAVDSTGKKAVPRLSPGAPGGVVSNDWWSSLIYPLDPTSLDSLPLYAHPLVFQTHKEGIGVSYPNEPTVLPREYMYRYEEDLLVGLDGFQADKLTVTGHSDFAVSFDQAQGTDVLHATMGHGLPYLQLSRDGLRNASIRFGKNPAKVTSNEQGVAVIEVGARAYAAFTPSGTWETTEGGLTSDLGGGSHFAVAALPDKEAASLALLTKHAFAFVTGSEISWKVEGTKVVTNYRAKGELVEPCASAAEAGSCERSAEPLLALYPHQWGHTSDALVEGLSYVSPRGAMKLSSAGQFSTELSVQGLLPILPASPEEKSRLGRHLKRDISGDLFPLGLGENPAHDAYWDGKSLGRVATLVQIADQIGETKIRDRLLAALETRLADWFDGEAPRYFYYDETWRSLMAFPQSYGSASHLNDHNFHYGYFVHAAATIAQFNPKWAEQYREFVNLLVRDVAAPSAEDSLFPRLRYFDPYAGHSWANGPAQFLEGNNEESSSEDVNFSWALSLWGALTDNKELEQLGLYLYATQVSTIEEYWFDVEERVFPAGFEHPTVAMVWGAGGKYDTWFDQDPAMIHGINFLPVTGGSLYLGRHPAYVKKNFQTILDRSHGELTTWRDPLLMFEALADPEEAFRLYKKDRFFKPEFGASRTMTRLWLTSLVHFGLPQWKSGAQSDSPYAVEFEKSGIKTQVVFSPTKRETTQSVAK